MAFQMNSYNEYAIPSSSDTPPAPRKGWWSRPIVTVPTTHGEGSRKPTCKETTVACSPCLSALITIIAAVAYMYYFVDNANCDAKFVIQSIVVSPSSAKWHVDFLVKNPSSRFSIYYESDETAVSLGPLRAAVLNTSCERKSPSQTAFSVDFVAEGNPNDVVFEQLDIKLRAEHKSYGDVHDNAGHVDITCHNLTRSHDQNVEKILCLSFFTNLDTLSGNPFSHY